MMKASLDVAHRYKRPAWKRGVIYVTDFFFSLSLSFLFNLHIRMFSWHAIRLLISNWSSLINRETNRKPVAASDNTLWDFVMIRDMSPPEYNRQYVANVTILWTSFACLVCNTSSAMETRNGLILFTGLKGVLNRVFNRSQQ